MEYSMEPKVPERTVPITLPFSLLQCLLRFFIYSPVLASSATLDLFTGTFTGTANITFVVLRHHFQLPLNIRLHI